MNALRDTAFVLTLLIAGCVVEQALYDNSQISEAHQEKHHDK